jgi:glycosyltransferase involved in cell wall biosynthesis
MADKGLKTAGLSCIRVLHFVSTLSHGSGVMSVIMNYYRHIDREKVQFDFLHFVACEDSYADEIKSLGGKIYCVEKPGGSLKSVKQMNSFFQVHAKEYTWLHNHEVYLTFLLRPISKRYGLEKFIVHCHATKYSDKPLHAVRNGILCLPIRFMKVERFACSEAAGKFLYGERLMKAGKVFVMHNAIDCEKFRFRPEVRERLRKEMGLEGKFVIGHVGRFERQKNHEFLIEVFAECKKEIDNCILLLIGEGSLSVKIKKKVVEKGLENSILFFTKRNDMEYLYQVMDLFVLPSLYEGLPVSCLEAQVNGLKCIISRTVTDELKKQTNSSIITMLPLEKNVWKQNIISCKIRQITISQQINTNNYDINLQSCRLHSFYTGKNE